MGARAATGEKGEVVVAAAAVGLDLEPLLSGYGTNRFDHKTSNMQAQGN